MAANPKAANSTVLISPPAIFPPIWYAMKRPTTKTLKPMTAWLLIAGTRALNKIWPLLTPVQPFWDAFCLRNRHYAAERRYLGHPVCYALGGSYKLKITLVRLRDIEK